MPSDSDSTNEQSDLTNTENCNTTSVEVTNIDYSPDNIVNTSSIPVSTAGSTLPGDFTIAGLSAQVDNLLNSLDTQIVTQQNTLSNKLQCKINNIESDRNQLYNTKMELRQTKNSDEYKLKLQRYNLQNLERQISNLESEETYNELRLHTTQKKLQEKRLLFQTLVNSMTSLANGIAASKQGILNEIDEDIDNVEGDCGD